MRAGAALKYMKDTMFSSNNGDRSNVPNFGIIITDGESNDPGNTKVQAELVRRAGITLFSVGVGANIKMSELEEMATDPDASHVFTVNDFSKLAQIKALFQRQTCGEFFIFLSRPAKAVPTGHLLRVPSISTDRLETYIFQQVINYGLRQIRAQLSVRLCLSLSLSVSDSVSVCLSVSLCL